MTGTAMRHARPLGAVGLAGGGALLAAGAISTWLLTHPATDPRVVVPFQHFAIVSIVSVLALGLAVLLARAALQIAQYRALFLALGFMAMAGIFAVHGISTPGILTAGPGAEYAGSVVGISAYLSLFVPALFFAATYTGVTAAFERRLPFSPAGWLIVVLGTLLGVYAVIALAQTELLAALPFGTQPYSLILAAVTCALLTFAAVRQGGAYLQNRLPMQALLGLVFLLLIEAQLEMVLGQTWTMAWWQYHVTMLVAVTLAFVALDVQRRHGLSLRAIVEGALELEVKVGVEMEAAETIAALVAAVEARDENTKGHNMRVAELSLAIGHELGLPTHSLRVLARAGMLHDVGKIGIPDAVLSKPGALDDEEWKIIKRHPELGVEILKRLPTLRHEAEVVAAHHERIDGSGYPAALKGAEIPLEARIVAVADTYDVLVSDRPYRKARGRAEAIRIVREESGTHLDRAVVEALLRVLGETGAAATQPHAA